MAGNAQVLLKIDRAATFLAEMEQISTAFDAECRAATVESYDDQRASYVYRIKVVPAVPDTFALAFGDAIHNLRTALDHIARQLVIKADMKPTDGSNGTSFNIRMAGDSKAVVIPTPADQQIVDALNAMQPRTLGSDARRHWLSILHQLDLADKHRRMLLTVAAVGGASLPVEFDDGPLNLAPVGDGDEVASFQTTRRARAMSDRRPVVSYFIYVDEPTLTEVAPLGAVYVVRRIREFVLREVVAPLTPFL